MSPGIGGWVGQAILQLLPVLGCPTKFDNSRARAGCYCSRYWTVSLISLLFPLSETA